MTYDPSDANDDKMNQLLDIHRTQLLAKLADEINNDQPTVLTGMDQKIVLATLQAVQLDAEIIERQFKRACAIRHEENQ